MYELVRVGPQELVGEIIKLERDTASIQCYEDTSGLTIDDPVLKTGDPLSVELGPGILSNIFDGIQRPLDKIAKMTNDSVFIPKGVNVPALDQDKEWYFVPLKLKVGDPLGPGYKYGHVFENELLPEHMICLPPKKMGKIKWLAEEGNYTLRDQILEIENVHGKVES